MNIGTVSWRKAASESVSSQVVAAEVEASCFSARSVYQVRPSTASGLLIAAVQVSPSCVAISPPAPQTKGMAEKMLPPATGKGIQSGSCSLSVVIMVSRSSQLWGCSATPAASSISRLARIERTPAYQGMP